MVIRIIIMCMAGLSGAQHLNQPYSHHLEFVTENDLPAQLIEKLYLSSSRLPPEIGSFYTYADLEENVNFWTKMNPTPTFNQSEILNELKTILNNVRKENVDLSQASFTPTIEIATGFDYIYHPLRKEIPHDSLFFNVFRDRDFITKFNQRGNVFSVKINSSYWKYIYFSSQFGLREDWVGMRYKNHHFARSFHQIDNNFNQHAYGTFRFGPLLLNSGRSRATMGLGNHGKLLLGNEAPPLDVFRASVKFGKYFKFYNYMLPLNNISVASLLESEFPKYLLAHRVTWDLSPYIRIAGNEMMIMNSYLKWNYLNPLIVYHNVTNADFVNILTSLDIEFVSFKNIRGFLSIAVDEIDFYLIEPESDGVRDPRLATGLHAGIKYLEPGGLKNSRLIAEYVKTDRWLYNYEIADNSKDLTYTFVEKIEFPDEHYFYRFVGHYLGSNASAFFLDFEYREFSIHYTDIDRGNNYILDFDDTWNEELPDVREKSKSIYLDWSGGCFDSRISVKSRLGYTWVDNYHHIENQYFEWPEIWLSLNYRLFFLTDI